MDNLIYAVRLPLPTPLPGSATEEFDRLTKKYRLHPRKTEQGEEPLEVMTFSPNRWYTSKELLNLFKLARGQVENFWEFGIKRINKKVEDKEEKDDEIDSLKDDLIKDLHKFKELFPKMVGEYRKRFEQAIADKSAEEQAKLKADNDFGWIEHPDEFIKKIQDIVLLDDEIKKIEQSKALGDDIELERRENQKTEPKQTGWNAELETKFKDIEHELKQYKSDIGKLSDKFKIMPIPAPELSKTAEKTEPINLIQEEKSVHQLKPQKTFRRVYKFLSNEKKKELVDKYLKSEGGENTSIVWGIPTPKLNEEIVKLRKEIDDLEHQRSLIKDNDAEFKEMEKPLGEKSEELDLLRDIEHRRESQEKFTSSQKKSWTKEQSQAFLNESESYIDENKKKVLQYKKEIADYLEAKKKGISSEEDKKEIEEKLKDVEREEEKPREYKGEKFLQVQFVSSLLKNLDWYKKLYSLYHACFWSHTKQQEVALEERNQHKFTREITKTAEDDGAAKSLEDSYSIVEGKRNNAYKIMEHFVGIDIHSKNAPYAAANATIKALEDFTENCVAYFKKLESHGQKIETFGTVPGKSLKTFAHYINKISEELGEKARVGEFDEIFPKEEVLLKLKGFLKDKDDYDIAKEDLDYLYDSFKKEFINPSAGFKRNVERAKEDPKTVLKKYIKAALDVFIEVWEKQTGKGKGERKPINRLQKRYPELYKKIKELEGKAFPELAESGEKGESSPGKPSSKAIVDYIEKTWMHSKPEEFKKGLREHFNAKGETYTLAPPSGGGANGEPGRAKEPKNIVNITDQKLLEMVENFLKSHLKSDEGTEMTPEAEADKFINSLLIKMGINLKREYHSTGEPIDIETVIRSIDKIISNIGFTVRRIKIYAPGTTRRAPPPGMTFNTSKGVQADNQSREWHRKHPEVVKRVPQFAPGQKPSEEGKPLPSTYRGLIGPGTYEDRRDVTRIQLEGSPKEQLKEAIRIHDKVVQLYKNIKFLLNKEELKSEFPDGLLASIDDLKNELGKNPPSSKQVEKELGKKKMEEQTKKVPYKEPEEKGKKKADLDLPLSFKLAQKFLDKNITYFQDKDLTGA